MTAVFAPARWPGTRNDTISALRDVLRPEFLCEAGWNPAHQLLAPPRAHPLLGMPECPIVGCTAGVYSAKATFCLVCDRRYRRSTFSLAEFLSIPLEGKPNRGEKFCIVTDCERPAYVNSGICVSHYAARRARFPELSVHDWIAQAKPSGFRSWGPCVVASCIRHAAHGSTGLCYPHGERWAAHRRRNGAANTKATIREWAHSAAPITVDYAVIFKGLPEQLILQILVGIQYRSDNGTRTFLTVVRAVGCVNPIWDHDDGLTGTHLAPANHALGLGGHCRVARAIGICRPDRGYRFRALGGLHRRGAQPRCREVL